MGFLKWLKSRLKEPSTYKAISAIGGIVGFSVSPEMWQEIATLSGCAISFVLFVEKERDDSEDTGQDEPG